MSASAAQPSSYSQLLAGREILREEARALLALSKNLSHSFCEAVDMMLNCEGSVIVTGIGKAGWVGQKISATFASTGARSHFLHPAEAFHGDLGRVGPRDVILAMSFSGESEEVVRLIAPLNQLGAPIIAMTGKPTSSLGQAGKVVIDLGKITEACPLGLAPTTSSTAMLAVGDALAMVVSQSRGFTSADFARYHPGGSLGRKLAKVKDVMRPLSACRVARADKTVRQVLVDAGQPGRRTGAAMLVDEQGLLVGLFTDSDLARLFERRRDAALDQPVGGVMTSSPTTVRLSAAMEQAVELLADRKISELPVIDEQGRPCGLIDITDVVGLLPEEGRTESSEASPTLRLYR